MSKTLTGKKSYSFLAVVFLSSCASTDSRPLLKQVRSDAHRLTGADLSLANELSAALLHKPLTSDSAAQIALANNRHLRAT